LSTHIDVVAADHLPERDLVAQAVGGLVGVHWHVHHIRGGTASHSHWRGTGQTTTSPTDISTIPTPYSFETGEYHKQSA